MENETILILDTQSQRGAAFEQGLSTWGLNVYRASRSREAENLFHVVKPQYLVIVLDDEGKLFFRHYVTSQLSHYSRCILLSDRVTKGGRKEDVLLNLNQSPAQIVSQIIQVIDRQRRSFSTSPSTEQSSYMRMPSVAPSQDRVASSLGRPQTRSNRVVSKSSRSEGWSGHLKEWDIARLLSILMRRRAVGKLLLTRGSEIRHIGFSNGLITGAESNKPIKQLPLILLRDGLLEQQEIERHANIISAPRPGRRLFELGLIQHSNIEILNNLYVMQVVKGVFAWEEGSFSFLPGAEDPSSSIVSIDLPSIILRGIREGYTLERLAKLLISPNRIPQWVKGLPTDIPLKLSTIDARIIEKIDGRSSIIELQRYVNAEPFPLYSLLYALTLLGYLTLDELPSDSLIKSTGAIRHVPKNLSPAEQQTMSYTARRQSVLSNKTPLPRGTFSSKDVQTPIPERRRHASFTPQRPATGSFTTPADGRDSRRRILTKSEQIVPSRSSKTSTGYHRRIERVAPTQGAPFERSPSRGIPSRRPQDSSVGARVPSSNFNQFSTSHPSVSKEFYTQSIPPSNLQQEGGSSPSHGREEPSNIATIQQHIHQKYHQVMTESYFNILDISETSTDLEIRRAYQKLRQMFADGRFPPAVLEVIKDKLKEIQQTVQEAYEVLSDPSLRQLYTKNMRR